MVKISHCLGVFLVVMDTKFSIVSNSGLYGELTLRGRTLGKKDNWMLNEGRGGQIWGGQTDGKWLKVRHSSLPLLQ